MPHGAQRQTGFSLIGVLITMVLIVILAAIGMQALSNAKGGSGKTAVQQNQISTATDREVIRRLYQGLATYTVMNDGRLPSPMSIAKSRDVSLNTSANFWSSLIAQGYATPDMLISGNEMNWQVVYADDDYNSSAYQPMQGIYWDPNFKADLSTESNVSFAHLVLYGERYRRNWGIGMGNATYPLLGNRGPKDGIPSVDSMACTSDGMWGGNFVYADGHVDFTQSPMHGSDNLFSFESGYEGDDCIITFTKSIWDGGFEIQFD